MFRSLTIACVLLAVSATSTAQSSVPPSLIKLPDAIRTLPWKSIDVTTVGPLESNRALMLMNYVLGELAPVRASDADLMSTYIEQKNLGADFAKAQALNPAPVLSFNDCFKIAVALLRGPMADSSYAHQLSDASPTTLAAYMDLYDRTCRRRWAEVAESTEQARYMQAFLRASGKFDDFRSWASDESANRQRQYEADAASHRKAAELKQQQASADLQRENEQLRQALLAAQSQAQTDQAQQASAQIGPAAEEDPYYYGGWYAPTYFGSQAAWIRDPVYTGGAQASTEARLAGFRTAAAAKR